MTRPLILVNAVPTPLPADRTLDALCKGLGLELVNNGALTLPQLSPVAAGYGGGVGGMVLARASSHATTFCCGILLEDTPPFASGIIQQTGIVEGTEAFWSVIANSLHGLISGETYWLSPAIAGRITSTPPNHFGDYVVKIGRALSPTLLLLDITPPIGL
jgi:hypothetical protein